ncbi:MAG TPA: sulfur transferase domain-containing protein, partial [Burkholderiaceae bacterium]
MSGLQLQQLSADVCVAPQLEPTAMAQAAAAGFRSIVNNRPDFEGGPDQPTSAALEAAAR